MTRSRRHGTNPGTLYVQLDTAFLDPAEIPDPIGRVLAEHYRARALCRILDEIADDPQGRGNQEAAGVAANYLGRDHALHVADERDSLIPLLRLRRANDPELDDACDLLVKLHERDLALARMILGDLRLMADGMPPRLPLNFIVAARTLAEGLARHLTWENSCILPVARRWLAPMDLAALDRDMRLRREEWTQPAEADPAGDARPRAAIPPMMAGAIVPH